MSKLVEGTRSEGAKVGGYWRINFSRVEWTVVRVGGQLELFFCSFCCCCRVEGGPSEQLELGFFVVVFCCC